ncbi:predicted protein [Arabidopsis lyrata subsp. lyrata]|uniref:Predicted protein n=1 Tax=Arabidopsis lyrata subsp. lyrata TaxID=81972 RepID=D7LAV6_ARALL|nr:predicted protein [Arabidopsis lyrata subsp. lyrata]
MSYRYNLAVSGDRQPIVISQYQTNHFGVKPLNHLIYDEGLIISTCGMKLDRGSVLKEKGVNESLGMVVLVVRPPSDDDDDDWQINDEDWD